MNNELQSEDTLLDTDGTLVTVGRFLDPAEAQIARGALEASGIAVTVQGEQANSLVPMAFRARLLVAPEDEAAARELLAEAGDNLIPGTDEGD